MNENTVIAARGIQAQAHANAEPPHRPSATAGDNRIAQVDVLRGIAIFGVLVLHSNFTSRFSEQALAVQGTMARLFDWAVLAFFFCSGFLHKKTDSLAVTAKKRFVSLMIPFFLYNAFYNLAFAVLARFGLVSSQQADGNLARLAVALISSPAFQLYFLPYLFLISVGICALDKLTQRHGRTFYGGLLVLAAAFYAWRGYPEISHGHAWEKIPLYVSMFLAGIMARPFLERSRGNAYGIAIVFGIVLCVLFFSRRPFASVLVPPVLLAWIMAAPGIARSKLLMLMGRMSGSIYVWHTPLLLPFATILLARLRAPSLVVLFGSLLLTLCACLVLRAGLDWFFERALGRRAARFITL